MDLSLKIRGKRGAKGGSEGKASYAEVEGGGTLTSKWSPFLLESRKGGGKKCSQVTKERGRRLVDL